MIQLFTTSLSLSLSLSTVQSNANVISPTRSTRTYVKQLEPTRTDQRKTAGIVSSLQKKSHRYKQGSHSFTDKKSRIYPGLSRTAIKIFQDLFEARECLNTVYRKKTAYTYSIQSVVHCRKSGMKQNVDVSYPASNSQHQLGAILLLLDFHLKH